jgi:hypothetical protein
MFAYPAVFDNFTRPGSFMAAAPGTGALQLEFEDAPQQF